MQREGDWNLLCKFFDNLGPIPHHMHQSDEFASLVGQKGKPEAYYFPPQYNQIENNFPYTFMGLEPGTTKEDVRRCLADWNKGDNGILNFSRAYRLQPGTGWQINPGILHAPGSLVTYEPQVNSDVFAMFQSEVEGRMTPWDLLVKDVPPDRHRDLDYIIGMLDWSANVNPTFGESNRYRPKPVTPFAQTDPEGYREVWVTYGTKWYSAKELTIQPKRAVTIKDAAAYGIILTQGHGTFGGLQVSTPAMIRFGQMTEDELFVTAQRAREGVRVENRSDSDPLVISTLALTQALGESVTLAEGSTDSNVAMSRGIPAVTLGAGGISRGAHSPDESFTITGSAVGTERALLVLLAAASGTP